MRCAHCGSVYGGNGGLRWPYYICRGKQQEKYGPNKPCTNKNRNARVLDEQVWSHLEYILCHTETILALFASNESTDAEETRLKRDLAECDLKLGDFERRRDRLLDLVENGDIDSETFRKCKARLDKARAGTKQLRDELSQLLDGWRGRQMQREDAEKLARVWRWYLDEPEGKLILNDAKTGENASDEIEFRKWVLGKLCIEVTIDGEKASLRGTMNNALFEL